MTIDNYGSLCSESIVLRVYFLNSTNKIRVWAEPTLNCPLSNVHCQSLLTPTHFKYMTLMGGKVSDKP